MTELLLRRDSAYHYTLSAANHDLQTLPNLGNLSKKQMGRNTSISLGQHHETFIQEQLKSGAYKNASEVVRAGLRLLQEREQKKSLLRRALEEGIQSGITTDFNPDEFLSELRHSRK